MRQEVQADKLCLDRNNQYLSCGEPPLDAARGCICNSEHPRTSASGRRGCALSVQRFLARKPPRESGGLASIAMVQSSTGGDEDGQAAEMISHVHDPKACTAHQRSSGRGDCEARLGVLLANTCSKATRASAWSGDTTSRWYATRHRRARTRHCTPRWISTVRLMRTRISIPPDQSGCSFPYCAA